MLPSKARDFVFIPCCLMHMPVASIQELGTVNWEPGGLLYAHWDSPAVPAFVP